MTPNRLAKSTTDMSVGGRSNVTPACCNARTISETHPCWPRSGTRNPPNDRGRSPRAPRGSSARTPIFAARAQAFVIPHSASTFALLLGGWDDAPVDEQTGGTVVMEGGNAQDARQNSV
jgi:hypothetical protein